MRPALVEGRRQVPDDAGDEVGLDRGRLVAVARDATRPAQQPIDRGQGEAHVHVDHERPGQAGAGHDHELGGQDELGHVVVEDELVRAGELDHDVGPQERREPGRRDAADVLVDGLQGPQLLVGELGRTAEVVGLDDPAVRAEGRRLILGRQRAIGYCSEECIDFGLRQHLIGSPYCITKSVKKTSRTSSGPSTFFDGREQLRLELGAPIGGREGARVMSGDDAPRRRRCRSGTCSVYLASSVVSCFVRSAPCRS